MSNNEYIDFKSVEFADRAKVRSKEEKQIDELRWRFVCRNQLYRKDYDELIKINEGLNAEDAFGDGDDNNPLDAEIAKFCSKWCISKPVDWRTNKDNLPADVYFDSTGILVFTSVKKRLSLELLWESFKSIDRLKNIKSPILIMALDLSAMTKPEETINKLIKKERAKLGKIKQPQKADLIFDLQLYDMFVDQKLNLYAICKKLGLGTDGRSKADVNEKIHYVKELIDAAPHIPLALKKIGGTK